MKCGPGRLQASFKQSVKETFRKTRKFHRECKLVNLDLQAYGPAWDNSAEKAIRLEFCWGCELVESGPGRLQDSLGQSCKGNHKENMRVL